MPAVLLQAVLFAQGAATPPEWVHLLPAGTSRGVDGRGPYILKDAQAVITASMAAGKLPIDENHAIDLSGKTGQPSPARGWIVEMQARPDGIWGRVDWNESGRALLSDRAYSGISPVLLHTKAGVVLRIERAALTNAPNLVELDQQLNSKQETGMDLAALRKALGLAETADEAAILAAVTANATAVTQHGQQLAAVAQAAGLDASLGADGLVTALAARQSAGDPSALAQQVVSLQSQIGTMQQERAREKAGAFVDGAIKAGKPIASLRDHYVTRHMADAAAVEKEVNALISINAGGVPHGTLNAQGQPDADAPTETEKLLASKTGMDVKKLVAQRKKREAASNGGNG